MDGLVGLRGVDDRGKDPVKILHDDSVAERIGCLEIQLQLHSRGSACQTVVHLYPSGEMA